METGIPLFEHPDGTPRSPHELTYHQSILLDQLHFYNWLLSGKGPKVPDEEILNNDAELDDYIEQWKESLEKQERGGTQNQGPVNKFNIG